MLKMPDQEELHWFPMRVTYSRELAIKEVLDGLGIESFIPMRYEPVEGRHPRHQELRPAIRNLIFVHSTRTMITNLKMTRRDLAPLRYMVYPVRDSLHNVVRHDILSVPDRQMEDFIRVASVTDDRVFYMENVAFAGKPGQRVKVVEGDFAGVEGIIKRVKKNKCVVVQIEHIAAVAIAFLPSAFLLPVEK